jgi:hypothetical protein
LLLFLLYSLLLDTPKMTFQFSSIKQEVGTQALSFFQAVPWAFTLGCSRFFEIGSPKHAPLSVHVLMRKLPCFFSDEAVQTLTPTATSIK